LDFNLRLLGREVDDTFKKWDVENSKMAARAGAENLHFTLNGEPRRPPGRQWPAPIRLGKTRTR
jgi:hypothetical protein